MLILIMPLRKASFWISGMLGGFSILFFLSALTFQALQIPVLGSYNVTNANYIIAVILGTLSAGFYFFATNICAVDKDIVKFGSYKK
jgi:hypothetical protein